MDPIEARLLQLWARLAAENAALSTLLRAGYALCEAEEMLWEEALGGAGYVAAQEAILGASRAAAHQGLEPNELVKPWLPSALGDSVTWDRALWDN